MSSPDITVRPAVGEVPSQIVHGTADVEAVQSGARYADADTIARQADEIFEKVKKANAPLEDRKKVDDLLRELQDEYKDFQMSFPVVMRYAVQRKMYNPAAFRKYLAYYATITKQEAFKQATASGGDKLKAPTVFSSRDRFIETQAEYVIFLIKEIGEAVVTGPGDAEVKKPHLDPKRLAALRSRITDLLKREDEDFTRCQKESIEELKKQQTRLDKERRADLLYLLSKMAKTGGATPLVAAATPQAAAAPTAGGK